MQPDAIIQLGVIKAVDLIVNIYLISRKEILAELFTVILRINGITVITKWMLLIKFALTNAKIHGIKLFHSEIKFAYL